MVLIDSDSHLNQHSPRSFSPAEMCFIREAARLPPGESGDVRGGGKEGRKGGLVLHESPSFVMTLDKTGSGSEFW